MFSPNVTEVGSGGSPADSAGEGGGLDERYHIYILSFSYGFLLVKKFYSWWWQLATFFVFILGCGREANALAVDVRLS